MYQFHIENGVAHVYKLKKSRKFGVISWVNLTVHKYFRFTENECYITPEHAWANAEQRLAAYAKGN